MSGLETRILLWALEQDWDRVLLEEAERRRAFALRLRDKGATPNQRILLALHRSNLAWAVKSRFYWEHSDLLSGDLVEVDFSEIVSIVFYDQKTQSGTV